jgi:transglutaminase-like putative cysteine protease
MRMHIRHDTQFRFETPAKSLIQLLRMTPRNHEGQHVTDWRIEVDTDCRLSESEDAFGNVQHVFSAIGPLDGLLIRVEGEVETFGTHSIIRGAIERFAPELYLRDTLLSTPDSKMRTFAQEACENEADDLSKMHALLIAVNRHLRLERKLDHARPAASAFARQAGSHQDMAQVFLACARHLGIPARYISGYHLADAVSGLHGWTEAYIAGLGWVGFDPAAGRCPDEAYVRVAIGLDSLAAAALRGAHYGGEGQEMIVSIEVRAPEAMRKHNQ